MSLRGALSMVGGQRRSRPAERPSPLRHIQDPASQRLAWNKPPKSVLVVKKLHDSSLLQPFKELCAYLTEVRQARAQAGRSGERTAGPKAGPGWMFQITSL